MEVVIWIESKLVYLFSHPIPGLFFTNFVLRVSISFEDGDFQDEQPSGNEVEVLDPEFEKDINAED